ncbi:hypothetical protein [uncultured Winogradskyella sp.]|uniref:hypothetical protein n=1 Tax=uncultured Winogradskyella sp. TaxID=395353 RepID=UPI0026097010|nr:hypothetical protein [uncultured Winogradskyella sp.]
MQILLAHSDKKYANKLKKELLNKNFKDIHEFDDGFAALSYIIQNYCEFIIIEENLPNLNATDIQRALLFKGIKTKFLIVKNKKPDFRKIEFALAQNYTIS